MNLYISDKPNWTSWVHVNIIIGNNRHIVEINDANVSNILPLKKFKECLFNDQDFETFTFCADDEGYHNGENELDEHIVDEDGEPPYSYFKITIKNKKVILNSFYKNSVIETILPITNDNKEETLQDIEKILEILSEGSDIWYGRCMDCM